MDIHTLVQWEQGTELSADVRLDLLKDIEPKNNNFNATKKKKTTEEEEMKRAHLSVTSNFDGLVFVPGVGQVSRLSERKLSPGKTICVKTCTTFTFIKSNK